MLYTHFFERFSNALLFATRIRLNQAGGRGLYSDLFCNNKQPTFYSKLPLAEAAGH